ncbi:MAG TPA: hypothetical protein VIK26_05660 [Clostridium sp.]
MKIKLTPKLKKGFIITIVVMLAITSISIGGYLGKASKINKELKEQAEEVEYDKQYRIGSFDLFCKSYKKMEDANIKADLVNKLKTYENQEKKNETKQEVKTETQITPEAQVKTEAQITPEAQVKYELG